MKQAIAIIAAIFQIFGPPSLKAATEYKRKPKLNKTIGLYPYSKLISNNKIKVIHDTGFFSCSSVRLHDIIKFFNYFKRTPEVVDSSAQFSWYKQTGQENLDISYIYFKNNTADKIEYLHDVDFHHEYQYSNYKELDYPSIRPFIDKYFAPSDEINNIIMNMESKYQLTDYDNLCVLFYRGNDKATETKLCEYSDIIEKAKSVQNENSNVIFLIQSDETEFINAMSAAFPNSFYFKEEIRHIPKSSTTVDKVFKSQNHEFSKYYLAITIIMSKCKYIVCGSSGNCSIWIMFYRNNANNVFQYRDGAWVQ